jgi:hypothetical protein
MDHLAKIVLWFVIGVKMQGMEAHGKGSLNIGFQTVADHDGSLLRGFCPVQCHLKNNGIGLFYTRHFRIDDVFKIAMNIGVF